MKYSVRRIERQATVWRRYLQTKYTAYPRVSRQRTLTAQQK